MSELLKDPTLEKLLMAAVAGLVTALVALWRRDVSRSSELAQKAEDRAEEERRKTEEWRKRWAEEVKASSRDAERFLRVLDKRRGPSSGPPSR